MTLEERREIWLAILARIRAELAAKTGEKVDA
jgi:hypothetical protein